MIISIRSNLKKTFHKPSSDPHKVAMEELFVVKENDLIVNITFAWKNTITIVKKEDDVSLVAHKFPNFRFDFEGTFFRH